MPAFRKTCTAIKDLIGPKYRPNWKRILKNWGHSTKWKELAVNRTLLAMTKKPANTFFMIVPPKARKAAEAFATTVQRWTRGRKTNQKVTPLRWQRPWALSF